MRRRELSPIWDAYADADMANACPACNAPSDTFCTNEITGRLRRVPCIARTTLTTTTIELETTE